MELRIIMIITRTITVRYRILRFFGKVFSEIKALKVFRCLISSSLSELLLLLSFKSLREVPRYEVRWDSRLCSFEILSSISSSFSIREFLLTIVFSVPSAFLSSDSYTSINFIVLNLTLPHSLWSTKKTLTFVFLCLDVLSYFCGVSDTFSSSGSSWLSSSLS